MLIEQEAVDKFQRKRKKLFVRRRRIKHHLESFLLGRTNHAIRIVELILQQKIIAGTKKTPTPDRCTRP